MDAEVSSLRLSNGVEIERGTTILSRQRVEFDPDVFAAGEQFEIEALEYVQNEGEFIIWLNESAPLACIELGVLERLIPSGKWVIVSTSE